MTTTEQIESIRETIEILLHNNIIDVEAINNLLPLGYDKTPGHQLNFLARMVYASFSSDDEQPNTKQRLVMYDKYLQRNLK